MATEQISHEWTDESFLVWLKTSQKRSWERRIVSRQLNGVEYRRSCHLSCFFFVLNEAKFQNMWPSVIPGITQGHTHPFLHAAKRNWDFTHTANAYRGRETCSRCAGRHTKTVCLAEISYAKAGKNLTCHCWEGRKSFTHGTSKEILKNENPDRTTDKENSR